MLARKSEMMMEADAAAVISKCLEAEDGTIKAGALEVIPYLGRRKEHAAALLEEGVYHEIMEVLERIPQDQEIAPLRRSSGLGLDASQGGLNLISGAAVGVAAGGEAIMD